MNNNKLNDRKKPTCHHIPTSSNKIQQAKNRCEPGMGRNGVTELCVEVCMWKSVVCVCKRLCVKEMWVKEYGVKELCEMVMCVCESKSFV